MRPSVDARQKPQPPSNKNKVLIAVAVVVVLAAVAVSLMRRPHRGASEASDVKRVAVLPFANLGAPEDDYFADGMGDRRTGHIQEGDHN